MLIPSNFTDEIAKAFYDKTVSKMSLSNTVDAEGGVSHKGLTVTSTFKGNVNFSNCKQIQEDYGLDYDIDLSITTNTETVIGLNDIIKYNERVYVVNGVLPFDSHILIVAKIWQQ